MKQIDMNQLKISADKKPACSVVITCSMPTEGGKMQVEMKYLGDPDLVEYLLHEALGVVKSQNEELLDDQTIVASL